MTNERFQFVRGTTAEMNMYTGRDGEISIDKDKKQIRLHNGTKKGGDVVGSDSVTVEVESWAGSNWTAPLGVIVAKALAGTSLSIKHNKGRFPIGWFAFNRASTPMVGLIPSATTNIQVVNENEVIITGLSSLTKFNVSLNFG
ncbi:MAG: hypothetical protein IBX57_00855 [Gammaproteobacteria bacterium]|nr:hypothetical protein [Gammaproteobacteria bacterium]